MKRQDDLTKSSSHWTDDYQIDFLGYWKFRLQMLSKLVALLAKAEIGEGGIVKIVVLWRQIQSAL